VQDLGPQPRPDRCHRLLELIQNAADQLPLPLVGNGIEHGASGQRVLDVPHHRPSGTGMREAA
jgi:hypothetical protein